MKDKQLFAGFSLIKKSKETAAYFAAEELVLKGLREGSKPDDDKTLSEAHSLFKELVICINRGDKAASTTVQKIIQKHHTLADQFHESGKLAYKALAKLYREHPGFRRQMEPFHINLAEFMADAMDLFAETNLD